MHDPIQLIASALGCNQSEIARRLSVTRATISSWKTKQRIPVKRVKELSEITGVPAHVLCPDYFPNPNRVER